MDLAVLFASAFVASTILPMSSEAVLAAMAVAGSADRVLMFLVATAGNTLGAVVNWALGSYAAHWISGRVARERLQFERASRWFQRWGVWCLLLSWLPVVGDPLTLVAGLLRTAFVPFVLLVLIGKASRYALILILAS
jgi:membrane protein YqaA with SNARE-associated domain